MTVIVRRSLEWIIVGYKKTTALVPFYPVARHNTHFSTWESFVFEKWTVVGRKQHSTAPLLKIQPSQYQNSDNVGSRLDHNLVPHIYTFFSITCTALKVFLTSTDMTLSLVSYIEGPSLSRNWYVSSSDRRGHACWNPNRFDEPPSGGHRRRGIARQVLE